MTVLNFSKITAALAALDVPGLSILDTTQIPADAIRSVPALIPLPNNFVTNYRQERQSYGSGSIEPAKYDIYYNLTYRLLFMVAGADRGIATIMPRLLDLVSTLIGVILVNDAINGLVDLQFNGIANFGALAGPDDKLMYWGCDVTFQIQEFSEVSYT
jgi:hypothetical protein